MGISDLLQKTYPKIRKPTFAPKVTKEPEGRAPPVDWAVLTNMFLQKDINAPDTKRRQGIFHPSSGLTADTLGCDRQMVLDLICAKQTPSKINPKLAKILENGNNRHVGLQAMFERMAEQRFFGIVKAEREVSLQHPTLPLAGHADMIVTMQKGWKYLLDFKTIGSSGFKDTFSPKPAHRVQLNTYMGMAGIGSGYVIYENRDSLDWATPMDPKFRVNFDAALYLETEQLCERYLRMTSREELPEKVEKTCKAAITFCKYEGSCTAHEKNMATFAALDQRTPEMKRHHLRVI